ncbi:hypothetical protein [Clostridium hydrogeniformans]|uniref:hypothetical protein n=1 Tax=Clostridium hydrogeniformans TaxID=349933 RepID=UPI00068D0B89|nr:hypothetical protein [Clostridium hydrogeniformans]
MSQELDTKLSETGTRFRVYPQNKNLKGFNEPELIYINSKPGTIKAGPQDDRMYVIDAKNKNPYDHPYLPPYSGQHYPNVEPDSEGHFDYIDPKDRAFGSTSMYASIRRVLDIWEDYFGKAIPWFFRAHYSRLEIIPRIVWNNAHAGYGFIEFGFPRKNHLSTDFENPYCENFDVVAHELGHIIKYEVIGFPDSEESETYEYGGHHEAFGDLISIVSLLHFDSVLNHLLDNTKGNLFSINELSRVGELNESESIRSVFNDMKMSDMLDVTEEHDLSLPFSGGAFDVLVEIYEHNLIEQGTIPENLAKRSYHADEVELPGIEEEFKQHFKDKKEEFKTALLDARDYFGKLMALTWDKTSPNNLYYSKVVTNMIDADMELSNGKYSKIIRDCFEWREIIKSIDNNLLRTWRVN